jgi:uncharacterized protein YndB with AHSA1/START domain
LTDTRLLSRWFLPTDFELAVGATFSLVGGVEVGLPDTIRGDVAAVIPGRMLTMTWRAHFLQARVIWELVPTDDDGCTLYVTLSGFASPPMIVRRELDAFRARFTEALPHVLEEMALRADLAAEIVPAPDAVVLNFAKRSATGPAGDADLDRRATDTADGIAPWPRHRISAAVAGGIALATLVVLLASGVSLFAGPLPSAANPAAPGSSMVNGGVSASGGNPGSPASMTASPTIVIGAPTPAPSGPGGSGSPSSESSPTPSPTIVADAPSPLAARYATTSTFDGGYTGEITVSSTGPTYRSWTVTITIPASAQVTTSWEAAYDAHGSSVTFRPGPSTEPVTPGSPVTFGFQVSSGQSPAHPLTCSIAFQPCGGG